MVALVSSCLYCLSGGLDDGRGRARVGLFRHKHEVETGRTSSVGMEVRNVVASSRQMHL